MMNKSEREMYERALQCGNTYKKKLDTLEEKIKNIEGFCKVYLIKESLLTTEIELCETVLKYLRS